MLEAQLAGSGDSRERASAGNITVRGERFALLTDAVSRVLTRYRAGQTGSLLPAMGIDLGRQNVDLRNHK